MTEPEGLTPAGLFDLLDWKRRIFGTYAEVRAAIDPASGWRRWRAVRDELFATHPQSPVPPVEREGFPGLPYFDYDPRYRVAAEVRQAEPERYDIATSGEAGGSYAFTRFATVGFDLLGEPAELELYWLEG